MTATLKRRIADAVASHRKRAKAVGLELDYDGGDLLALVTTALAGSCPYCRGPMSETSWSIDHDTPTSRRGSFCLWNLRAICKRCNTIKGAMTGEEFAALMALLRELHPDAQTDVMRRLMAGGGTWKRGKR